MVKEMEDGKLCISRRFLLSVIMAYYDPLGLVSPIIIKARAMVQRLYGPGTGGDWDTDIKPSEKEKWVKWFQAMIEVDGIAFHRTTHPPGAQGKPWLVGFSDGSLMAYCASIYMRWKTSDGYVSRILMAKCLLSPLHGTTVPRAELQGLMVLLRLIKKTLEAVSITFKRVVVAVDSECVIAALQKAGHTMGPFFTNRVSEANQLMEEIAAKAWV